MTCPKERCRNPKGSARLYGGTVAACILMIALLPALLPATGAAHPPKEVALSYDRAKHMLEVRITHSSPNPAAHYINKVEIKKNNQTISAAEYQSQPGQATFAYLYPVGIGPVDVLEVTVACSVFGSKTEKLTAP
jgi:hypothetical protein